MRAWLAAPAVAGAVIFLACGRNPAPGRGELKDAAYRNEYFRLSLAIPAGWTAQKTPFEGLGEFTQNYLKLIAAGGAPEGTPLDRRMHGLLALSTVASGLLGADDATISLSAAELGARPIRAVKDLLQPIEAVLVAMNPRGAPKTRTRVAELGGATCAVLETKLRLKEGELHYRIYATARSGHLLVIETVARTSKGLARGESALRSLKF